MGVVFLKLCSYLFQAPLNYTYNHWKCCQVLIIKALERYSLLCTDLLHNNTNAIYFRSGLSNYYEETRDFASCANQLFCFVLAEKNNLRVRLHCVGWPKIRATKKCYLKAGNISIHRALFCVTSKLQSVYLVNIYPGNVL